MRKKSYKIIFSKEGESREIVCQLDSLQKFLDKFIKDDEDVLCIVKRKND